MPPTRRQFLGTTVITATFAGCLGGNGNGSNPDDGGDTTTIPDDTTATVSVASHDALGDILVGPDGMTLYMFVPDADTDGSACSGSCANVWPPLTVDGSPTAGDGVSVDLSTMTRADGATQVVAGEWPLYTYSGDSEPGDASGQGVNDAWYVLGPDGTPKRPETTTSSPTTTEQQATVQVRTHDTLGEILVGPDGMTLYMFDNDTKGSGSSSCTGGCASTWPPLTVEGDPTSGDGVTAPFATLERESGKAQVTANGWPLYYYGGDSSPGDANGQGVGGVWYVLRPDGTPIRGDEESAGY